MTQPHSITYIIEEVLALDKTITLKFSNKKSFESFKAMLSVYLKRYNRKLDSIGAGDIFEGKVPSYIKDALTATDDTITVTVSLTTKKAKPAFEILQIQECSAKLNDRPGDES